MTAIEACEFVANKLNDQYEKRISLWAEEDIAPMSPMFQSMIRARKAAAQTLHARVRFAQQRVFDTHLMPEYIDPDDDL